VKVARGFERGYTAGMRAAVWLLGALLGLAACGDDETVTGATGTGAAGGGGGGSGGGGGAACPPGSHAGAMGCEAELSGWTPGPSLMNARDHHVTFVGTTPNGAFLYALVGTTPLGGAATSVERAPIEGGMLGSFEALPNAPEGLIGPGFAQVGSGFVIAGGLVIAGGSTTDTFVGNVQDDGSLSLSPGAPLAHSRYHVALAASKGFVFAIGGLFQDAGPPVSQMVEASIERASFDGTTLGAWQDIDPLPAPRTHHALVAYDGALYVIGGGSGQPASTDVLRSVVADDGTLGPWTPAGTLPEGRATSSAFVFVDHLYVVAGMTLLTGDEKATVLRAPIAEDGSVGAFEEVAALPLARAHAHQAPMFEDLVFSAGGSINHVDQSEVFVGRFE
jgi:Kelch motif protein